MSAKRARVAVVVRLRAADVFETRDPREAPVAYRRWRRLDRAMRDRGVRLIACTMRQKNMWRNLR